MTVFALGAALLTALALAAVLVPLLRRPRSTPPREDYDLAVYREQLKELGGEAARGVIGEGQAALARTEIERRMLRAMRAQEVGEAAPVAAPRAPGRRRRLLVGLGAGLTIPALTVGLYLSFGAPGLPGRSFVATAPTPSATDGGEMERLANRLATTAESLDDWLLLGRSYLVLGRYGDAVEALRRAASLSGGDPPIVALLGEAMVWANGGTVTADAVHAFEMVRAAVPDDPAARYHLALAHAQAGDIRAAYDMWLALAADTPADVPWRADLDTMIRRAADELGIALAELPSAPPARGPTAEDVAAAEAMTAEERSAAIRAMVEGLAMRLEEAPGDLEGWRRLARSYAVLGEAEKERAALRRALALAPEDVSLLEAYGRALMTEVGRDGNPTPEAVSVYERLLALDPDHGEALWFKGLAEAQGGDAAAARALWQRLLAQHAPGTPGHRAVQDALDAL